MHKIHFRSILVILTGGLMAAVVRGEAEVDATRAPSPLQPVTIYMPGSMQYQVQEGDVALVALRIDKNGRIQDWVGLNLPHYRLVEPLGAALKSLTFSPAMEGGNPVAADTLIEIRLGEGIRPSILSLDAVETHLSRITRMGVSRMGLQLARVEELDHPLVLLGNPEKIGVKNESGEVLTGIVAVNLYVDQNGEPHLITAEESDQPALEQAAIEMVGKFRFEPPTSGGAPATVRVRIPVQFN